MTPASAYRGLACCFGERVANTILSVGIATRWLFKPPMSVSPSLGACSDGSGTHLLDKPPF